jgi:hypothetical protein
VETGGGLTPAVVAAPGDRGLGFWVVGVGRRFSGHRRSGVGWWWEVAWRGGEGAVSSAGGRQGLGRAGGVGCRRRKTGGSGPGTASGS